MVTLGEFIRRATQDYSASVHYIDVDTTLSGPLAPSRMRCLVRSIEGEDFPQIAVLPEVPMDEELPAMVVRSLCDALDLPHFAFGLAQS